MSEIKFFREQKLLDEELKRLKKEGFDTLHRPGGSSLDQTFAVDIYLWCFDNYITKDVYLVVVPYKSLFYKDEVKDIINKKETPKQAIIREVFEETGIKIFCEDLKLTEKVIKGEKNNPFYHYRFFYKKYLMRSEIPKEYLEKSGEIGTPMLIKKILVPKYLLPKKSSK